MKIEVEMTRKQRTKNKMADSDCDLQFKAVLFIKFTDSNMCIVFVCVRFFKNVGNHFNQSGLLNNEILILLSLARLQNLGTEHHLLFVAMVA